VKCSFESPYGEIVSNWKRENDIFTWDISVPPNTNATVFVPGNNSTESGLAIEDTEGISFLKHEEDHTVFRVESGKYSFKSLIN